MTPQHVSIIMDGNGRWAAQRGLERSAGHVEGVESVRAVTTEAARAGIRYLSLYAFSEENWNRPAAEVQAIMELMARSVLAEEKLIMDNDIRFRVLGNRAHLKPSLLEAIDDLERRTASNGGMTMLIMLSYSGRWDIVQAARKYASACVDAARDGLQAPEIDVNSFGRYLVTEDIPDPDLLIRTSGELRLSNYLLWQCAYTEIYVTDTLWPDFRTREFRRALENYSKRDRRYGNVK